MIVCQCKLADNFSQLLLRNLTSQRHWPIACSSYYNVHYIDLQFAFKANENENNKQDRDQNGDKTTFSVY